MIRSRLARILNLPPALLSNRAVGRSQSQKEIRFRTPQLLSDNGIKRAINVLIRRGGASDTPFGVLEEHTPDPGQFDDADADFMAGFAGLLGIAIERQHADAELQKAHDHADLLTSSVQGTSSKRSPINPHLDIPPNKPGRPSLRLRLRSGLNGDFLHCRRPTVHAKQRVNRGAYIHVSAAHISRNNRCTGQHQNPHCTCCCSNNEIRIVSFPASRIHG